MAGLDNGRFPSDNNGQLGQPGQNWGKIASLTNVMSVSTANLTMNSLKRTESRFLERRKTMNQSPICAFFMRMSKLS